MNPDNTVRDEKPEDEQDPAATRSIRRPDDPAPVSEGREATSAEPSPEPLGWAAQIRQAMQRSPQGERGPAGKTITGWIVDRGNFRVTPRMSDGSLGAPLELRSLFEPEDNAAA